MSSIKNFSFILIIWAAAFGFVFIVFEAGLRMVKSSDEWNKAHDINILRNVEYKYDLNDIYESDNKIVDYIRNEFGLRDNCSSPQQIDILTIGGSTTDQRFVVFEDTFQTVLQKLLSERANEKVCVSNAGLDGHSTFGHVRSFEVWFPLIPNLAPEYVLLYIGVNDVSSDGPNIGFDQNGAGTIKGFLKGLAVVRMIFPLYRFIRDGWTNRRIPYAGHHPTKPKDADYTVLDLNDQTKMKSKAYVEAFKIRLQSLLTSISKMGSSPICVTQPHLFMRNIDGVPRGLPINDEFSGLDYDYSIKMLNEAMVDLCGWKNTIDIHNAVFEEEHFYDVVHTTDLGSRYIGELIFNGMKEKILQ